MADPPPLSRAGRLGLDVELRSIRSGDRRWPAHWHADLQAIATLEGSGAATVGGRRLHLNRGAVLIVPPGTAHTACAADARDWTFLSLHVAPERLGPAAGHDFAPLLAGADDPLSNAFRRLVASLFRRRAGTEDACLQRLIDMLAERLRPETRPLPDWLSRARGIVEADLSAETNAEIIGRRLGIGRRRLERGFRAAFHLSPMVWRANARIEAAKARLRQDGQVAAAATAAGFTDPARFSRTFRRLTGLAPRSYAQAFRPGLRPDAPPPRIRSAAPPPGR